MRATALPLFLIACTLGCAGGGDTGVSVGAHVGAEATSLLGTELARPALNDSLRASYEEQLRLAQADLEARPDDPEAVIWVGRRLGYLGRFRDAIDVFTQGIQRFPDDARMYRHRGHRYITVRMLDSAIADFDRAVPLIAGRHDEMEPDGLPNARNIPTSSLQSNIWYHLALAHYLKGDLERARAGWEQCMHIAPSEDMRIAAANWLYMTVRRQGDLQAARALLDGIATGLDIIENQSYYRLLLFYKRLLPRDSLAAAASDTVLSNAAIGYGLANWELYNGDTTRALATFQRVLRGEQWPAFGYIAAESDVARLRR